MASDHYAEFIEEAFIKPIRSVLIVDDDYPTFDEILGSKIAGASKKGWHSNPERIKGVIDKFRSPDRPLLVDIHDGTNVKIGAEVKVAEHLYQSDLLVLDYQLDKSRRHDGTRSIRIVRSLMANDHFNLVVVHTVENLDAVFREYLVGLMRPLKNLLSKEESKQAQGLIEDGEDEVDGFSRRLFESVIEGQYLHYRRHPSISLGIMAKAQQPYSAFMEQCDVAGWDLDDRKLVLRYALVRVERELRSRMYVGSSSDLLWSDGPIKWIKADSVFVAFSKKDEENDLIAELREALKDWGPDPSRLFLAKIRAEMDDYGVVAQTQALGKKHALAHWYNRLLRADVSQRRSYVAETVSRHSEQLMSIILPRVEEFAARLVGAEVTNGEIEETCKNHFDIDLAKPEVRTKAGWEHNAFVCSTKRRGWHLTTGHVFLLNDEYWLTLSPACDMVPSQISEARIDAYGERLPFMAVKLFPIDNDKIPKDIQSNRFMFLNVDGQVRGFCFNNPTGANSAPQWHMLFAENRGQFREGSFDFSILRTEIGSRGLVSRGYDATVIGQLRYEYALNMMQRLGMSLTRIGLDFVGRDSL